MVRFGMFKDTPGAHLARDAGLLALHDAGLTLADVDEAFVGYIQPASMLGIKAMKEFGLTGLPVTHIENASATGLVAFREAAWAVSSGRADVAMALCFDKFTDMTGGGGRGPGRDQIDAPDPAGRLLRAVGAAPHARTRHDAGALRHHCGEELELRGQVPDSTPPVRPRGDGRGGPGGSHGGRTAHHHDVLSARRRGRLHHRGPRRPRAVPAARPAPRTGPGLGSDVGDLLARPHLRRPGGRPLDHDEGHGAGSVTRRRGSAPRTSSVAYCHDAFVNEELEYYELLGFCAEGDGEKLVVEGETGPGGRIPFNTDGGLLARGHPGGPTGVAMLHEAVLQLRGEAQGRQVEGARVALTHLVGGGSIATVNLLGVERS